MTNYRLLDLARVILRIKVDKGRYHRDFLKNAHLLVLFMGHKKLHSYWLRFLKFTKIQRRKLFLDGSPLMC